MSSEYIVGNKKRTHKKRKQSKESADKYYYGSISGRAVTLWNSAKTRAKLKNVPFTLTKEWYIEKLNAGICEITGIPFILEKSTNTSENHFGLFYSPSVDRIVPILGYVPENCRMVIQGYNQCKGTATDADVLKMAEHLVRAYNG